MPEPTACPKASVHRHHAHRHQSTTIMSPAIIPTTYMSTTIMFLAKEQQHSFLIISQRLQIHANNKHRKEQQPKTRRQCSDIISDSDPKESTGRTLRKSTQPNQENAAATRASAHRGSIACSLVTLNGVTPRISHHPWMSDFDNTNKT